MDEPDVRNKTERVEIYKVAWPLTIEIFLEVKDLCACQYVWVQSLCVCVGGGGSHMKTSSTFDYFNIKLQWDDLKRKKNFKVNFG